MPFAWVIAQSTPPPSSCAANMRQVGETIPELIARCLSGAINSSHPCTETPMLSLFVIVPVLLAAATGESAPAQPVPATRCRQSANAHVSRPRGRVSQVSTPCRKRVASGTLLDDPRLLIYSDAEMPKAYQFFDGAFPGVHSVSYNISANGSEPFGNGNREFPWSHPAGTHRATNLSTFRFLWLSQGFTGIFWPVVWHSSGRFAGRICLDISRRAALCWAKCLPCMGRTITITRSNCGSAPAKSAFGTSTSIAPFRPPPIWLDESGSCGRSGRA